MSRKYFLGLMSVTMLTLWGCSSFYETSRYPAGTMDVGIIGSEGEVILFYRENSKIVVKQCDDYTVLKSRSDCKVKPGTVVKTVPVSDFKSSLKMALKLPGGNFDSNMKSKIELYNGGQEDDVKELAKEQKELKEEIAKIEAFIEGYSLQDEDTEHLSNLKDSLSQVEGALGDYAQLDQIIKEINGNIDYLVDNIISSETLYTHISSTPKKRFVFNILRAYLRAPMISASFQTIKSGSFIMGSPSGEINRDSDEGQKKVTISKSFDIMTTEVTQMQWFLVMGSNPSRFKNPGHCVNHININGEGLCPNNPVEQVSWNDVQTYIKKLNDFLGLSGCNGTLSDPKGCYRLPTEAEWEFAARGKTTTAYSFKNNLVSYAWYLDNSGNKTHPVGLKKPNPYGLYDVHGNVWEWVQDKYKDSSLGILDTSAGHGRVVRGGSSSSEAQHLRSANRRYVVYPSFGYGFVGFRLVRAL